MSILLAALVSFAAASPPVVERDVAVRMRDGVVLRADVWRPAAEGRFPVLVYRTPYEDNLTACAHLCEHLPQFVDRRRMQMRLGQSSIAITECFAEACCSDAWRMIPRAARLWTPSPLYWSNVRVPSSTLIEHDLRSAS